MFRSYSLDPIPAPKIAMAQLVKAKREENIPVLSGRLVISIIKLIVGIRGQTSITLRTYYFPSP